MTEGVAWLFLCVGVLSTVCAYVALWLTEHQTLAIVALGCLLLIVLFSLLATPATATLVAGICTAAGLLLSVAKYVRDRHNDEQARLRLEQSIRNDRLIADWQAFASNPKFIRAIYLLETEDPCLEQIGEKLDYRQYVKWKNPLDQVFDFLQRLAYSVECRNLERTAVLEAVGWYYRKVSKLPHIRRYCEKNGYSRILQFAEEHSFEE